MKIRGREWSAEEIAARIDHTVLAPNAVRADIEKACELARRYRFHSVFTNPYWTPLVAELLEGTGVAAGISAAFPLGSISTQAKVLEVQDAMRCSQGRLCAVDMVTNIGMLKDGRWDDYRSDIREVVEAARDMGGPTTEVKAIVESSLLMDEELRAACICAAEAGVNYVKTSTGRGGAPLFKHIGIMKGSVPASVGVKFSGFGTHNSAELAFMAVTLGADLLGSPQGAFLVDELCGRYATLDASMS